MPSLDHLFDGLVVVYVHRDDLRALGQIVDMLAAVEQRQLPASLQSQLGNCGRNQTRSADKQCLHVRFPPFFNTFIILPRR